MQRAWWRGALALVACALACALLTDRAQADLLVIGPHPDDDIITSAGVILRARQAGEAVRVVLMTNGDIAGEASGLTRQDEAIDALQALQVPEDGVIFLGYPDGYLADLLTAYADGGSALSTPWGSTTTYGARGLGSVDYHRYAFGASAANNGANVTADLAHLLSRFRPAHIFLTSEFDLHPDHSATYQFVVAALASLMLELPGYDPTLHQTIVWNDASAGPWPPGPSPDGYFDEPPGLFARSGLSWSARESLDVPLEMQGAAGIENLKWRAIQAHASQGGNDGYIGGFLRKDEFFWSAHARAGNRPPVPNAGADRVGVAGAEVRLDGSGSFDPDGTTPTFQWRQSAGPHAALSSESAAQPVLIVPGGAGIGTELAFELKVSDGTSTSVADAVCVRVAATLDPQDDAGTSADAAAEVDAAAPTVAPEPPDAAPAQVDAAAVPVAPEPPDAAPAQVDAAAATPGSLLGDASNSLTPSSPDPDPAAAPPDAGQDGQDTGAVTDDDPAPEGSDPGAAGAAPETSAAALEPMDTDETQTEAVAAHAGMDSDKGAIAAEAQASADSGCAVTGRSAPASAPIWFLLLALRLARRRATL